METLSLRYPLVFSAWGLLLPAAVAALGIVQRIVVPARVARWNGLWRADWERQHGRSLGDFRTRLTGFLRITRLLRWVVVGFLALALILDIEYVRTAAPKGLVGGLLFYPLLTFTSFILVVLLLLFVGEQMTSVKIRKVDELTRR